MLLDSMPGLLQDFRDGKIRRVFRRALALRDSADVRMDACPRASRSVALKPWLLVALLVLIASPASCRSRASSAPARRSNRCRRGSPTRSSGRSSGDCPSRTGTSDRRISSRTSTRSSTWCRRSSSRRSPAACTWASRRIRTSPTCVATRPRMAFIVDIRRGNLLEHLMYKAIIELSADRAEFRLAAVLEEAPGRPRADVVGRGPVPRVRSSVDDRARRCTGRTSAAIEAQLTKQHGFALSAEDLQQLEAIYFSFFWDGPNIRYSSFPAGAGSRRFVGRAADLAATFPSYEELMLQTDMEGVNRSYLATEENFRLLKAFEEKNLIVPGRRRFRRPEGAAGGRPLRARARRRRHGLLRVERRAVSLPGRAVRRVRPQRRDAAGRRRRARSFDRSRPASAIRGGGIGPDGRASALDPIRTFVREFLAGRSTPTSTSTCDRSRRQGVFHEGAAAANGPPVTEHKSLL